MSESVRDRASCVAFVSALQREFEAPSPHGPCANGWKSGPVDACLEASAARTEDVSQLTDERQAWFHKSPAWQTFARFLYMGRICEWRPSTPTNFIDIDGVQWVTAVFGYAPGDYALCRVGSWMQGIAASLEGRAFRVAGKEFLLEFSAKSFDAVKAVGAAVLERLEAVTDAFYEYPDPLEVLLVAYASRHASDFVGTLAGEAS